MKGCLKGKGGGGGGGGGELIAVPPCSGHLEDNG